jgi:cytochrome c biogenesis protein CcdA/thiol-disulfide isomerase/thioredoxin
MPLVLIGVLGGLITGLSPCILPVLPVVFLGGGTPTADGAPTSSRRRPFLVVAGLALSFAAFTLFGTLVLTALHLPADLVRWLGLAALVVLGLALVFPRLEGLIERPFSRIPQPTLSPDTGGFGLGIALGAVFVPCAGPVLAAITVAGTTGQIGLDTLVLTVSFAVGCAIPLLAFALAGREVVARVRAFQRHQRGVRVASGVLMIGLAVALALNVTDAIQRAIPNYTESIGNSLGSGLGAPGSGGVAPAGLALCQSAALFPTDELGDCGPAPEFAGIEQWLGTTGNRPLTLSDLRGKVVLVDFWAYSCINCQRELPHAQAWYERYAASGLVVVGVHTPEYAFEHDAANVAAGARRLGLTFPIALDNGDATWSAYDNDSWPAAYLIDATGEIRHVAVGEGGYAQEEDLIRRLLQAARPGVTLPPATDLPDTTPHDADQSPEMYLGSERTQYYAEGTYPNGTGTFSLPAQLDPHHYALAGTWTATDEALVAGAAARIDLSYHAAQVYLDVGGTGELRVSANGASRTIPVRGAPNIYTVAANGSAADGTVTISLSEGLRAYSFTFG